MLLANSAIDLGWAHQPLHDYDVVHGSHWTSNRGPRCVAPDRELSRPYSVVCQASRLTCCRLTTRFSGSETVLVLAAHFLTLRGKDSAD